MSPFTDFLNGKVFLITGATGFVAKGLVEKILRDVPDIKRIYLLIRPQKQSNGKELSAADRLGPEIFSTTAFAKLRECHGNQFETLLREKIVAVAGDLTRDQLGLDTQQYAELTHEVDIIINSAASVTFQEPIDNALQINTLGPKRLIEFAHHCQQQGRKVIFAHVSTAYVNGVQSGSINEKPLQPDCTIAHVLNNKDVKDFVLEKEVESILAMVEQIQKYSNNPRRLRQFQRQVQKQNNGKILSEKQLQSRLSTLQSQWIKERLIEEGLRRARQWGWYDCYTFTKAMGEQWIAKLRGDLPAVIIRPSIIESSLKEPSPGWVDGLKAADTLIVNYSQGKISDFPADPNIVLDIIPVDFVVNTILASLYKASQNNDLTVYHVATGSENPLLLGNMFSFVYEYFQENPMRNKRGEPISVTQWTFPNPAKFRRRYQFRYLIPLEIFKWLLQRVSLLPGTTRLYRKASSVTIALNRVITLMENYSFYANLNCRYKTVNTHQLYQNLLPEDKRVFHFDVMNINWQDYIQKIHIPGLIRHVLTQKGIINHFSPEHVDTE